jgi:hypothetical protein
VTAAGVGRPVPQTAPAVEMRPAVPGRAALRLARLHAASRRVLTCVLVLAAGAVALRIALHWLPRTGVYARQIPLIIEAGAAAVIGVTTRSPFGEPERATGRWLPWLRLAASVILTGIAVGALAAGAAAAHLAGGAVGLARDTAGFTGIALLTAAAAGGALAWIGPIAYVAVTLPALTEKWTTPWIWPARLPHDRGAAVCAALVFAAGVAVITARGARDRSRE